MDAKPRMILYGDSNTYGYDPRGMLGMRYSEAARWPTMLRQQMGDRYTIVEEGLNGRQLPDVRRNPRSVLDIVGGLSEGDVVVMMLGTNDILLTDHPNADIPIQKLEALLSFYRKQGFDFTKIIIAPPYIASESDAEMAAYYNESKRMNEGFLALCERFSVIGIDASRWEIPMGFDGVHFSEKGHRIFAESLAEALRRIL